jgi:hypothetical protein
MIRVVPNVDPNLDTGYALDVSCGGFYRIRKFNSQSGITRTIELVGPIRSEVITQGKGAQNRIGLLARGDTLYAVINGKVLAPVQDSQYSSGYFALYVNTVGATPAAVTFDHFTFWRIPRTQ